MISFFKGPIQNRVPSRAVSLEEIATLIKGDTYAALVAAIAAAPDKKAANKLKAKLDFVTFSGTFQPSRAIENLQQHSSYLIIDIDDLADVATVKMTVSHDPYVVMAFVSPRQNGLKLLFKIDGKQHSQAFLSISDYLKQEYKLQTDASGKDVSRVCYLSHDPALYFNIEAEQFQIRAVEQAAPVQPPVKNEASKPQPQKLKEITDFEYVTLIVERIEAAGIAVVTTHDEWLVTVSAFTNLGEAGRGLLHRVCRFSEKYDAQDTDQKFDHISKIGAKATIWTFIKNVKDYGIDTRKYERRAAIVKQVPAIEAKKPDKTAAKKFDLDSSFYKVNYDTVDFKMQVQVKKAFETIAENFLLYIKYMTESEREEIAYVMEIRPAKGDSVFIEVPHEHFMSAARLKSIVATKRYSLKLSDSQLDELRTYLFTRTEFYSAAKIIRFGYDERTSAYIFSNGALYQNQFVEPDAFNIVQIGEHYLSMPEVPRNQQHPFSYVPNEQITFTDWFEQMTKAYSYEDVFMPVCFYIFSLFRDIALKKYQGSPILLVKGPASSGKSSMIRLITALFGYQQPEINLKANNTLPALSDSLTEYSNAFIMMDEYQPEKDYESLLQSSFDNVSRKKKDVDNLRKNVQLPIKSALMLCSNYMPKTEWFFTRCLFHFFPGQQKTEVQSAAFHQLRDLSRAGLSSITVQLLAYRPEIEAFYADAYDNLLRGLRQRLAAHPTVIVRLIENMAQTLTAAYILHMQEAVQLVNGEPYDCLNDFLDHGTRTIIAQHMLNQDQSAVAEFFKAMQQLYESYQLHEGVHFEIEREGNGSRTINLNFSSIYTKFQNYYPRNNQGIPAPDKQTVMTDLMRLEDATDLNSFFRQQKFRPATADASEKRVGYKGSCSMNYDRLQQLFDLDLRCRAPQTPSFN
jgi:hypothetical protein